MTERDGLVAHAQLPLEGPRPVCACGHSRLTHAVGTEAEPCTILACGCRLYRRDYDEWQLRVKVRTEADARPPRWQDVAQALIAPVADTGRCVAPDCDGGGAVEVQVYGHRTGLLVCGGHAQVHGG